MTPSLPQGADASRHPFCVVFGRDRCITTGEGMEDVKTEAVRLKAARNAPAIAACAAGAGVACTQDECCHAKGTCLMSDYTSSTHVLQTDPVPTVCAGVARTQAECFHARGSSRVSDLSP